MPKSSVASTASGMLSDLKSRLGFSQDDGGSVAADNDFDEYDDFDDDGYSERYDSEYAGYGADYDENAPIGGFRPAQTRSSRYGRADSGPSLVSIDDVRANTPLPDEGTAPRRVGSRNLIDDRAPAQSSPAYHASLRDRERGASSRSGSTGSSYEASSIPSFEPYSAGSQRGLSIIRPITYSDAERVTRALKAGDVVVLAMRTTSEALMQRLLDFSFGAASALDAHVECPAERVFAIARGEGLTEEEKRNLRSQGVM